MIANPPATKKQDEAIWTKTIAPIHDTYNGTMFTIPIGWRVKVISISTLSDQVTVQVLHPDFQKIVKAQATKADLDLPQVLTQVQPEILEDEIEAPKIPRIYQEYGATFLLFREKAILADAAGAGKGHPEDTNILTPYGFDKLKNIRVGDFVIGSNGKPIEVTGVFPRGVLPVFRVSFNDGTSVFCDEEHIWTVWSNSDFHRNKKSKDLTTKYIKETLHRRYTIPMVEPIEFEEQPLKLHPYLMGVLLGDGSFRSHTPTVTISRQEIADTLLSCIPSTTQLNRNKEQRGTEIEYSITNKTITTKTNPVQEAIRYYGLNGLYSHEKFIPADYKFASSTSRLKVLQGLMDTDGWMQKETACMFASSSERLADDVIFLVQSFGGVARKSKKKTSYTYKGERKEGKTSNVVNISLPEGINPFYCRNLIYTEKYKYVPNRVIKSITPGGTANVICIKVAAEDNLYVTEHCLVTHNTLQAEIAAHRVMQALREKIDPLSLCYPQDFSHITDPKNNHPTTLPEWVKINESYFWQPSLNDVTIICAPSHLCPGWYRELRSQFPDEHAALAVADTRKNRMEVLEPGCKWYVVNYEMFRPRPEPKETDYEEVLVPHTVQGEVWQVKQKQLKKSYKEPVTYVDILEKLHACCVIFDESHKLKSSKSKQAQTANEFSQMIPYVFMLSATPISREADDLWYPLHILDPMTFQKMEPFLDDYTFYTRSPNGKQNIQLRDWAKRALWFNHIGTKDDTFLLGVKQDSKKYTVDYEHPNLNGYILGRSYKDIGIYLPDTIQAQVDVLMDTSFRIQYTSIKDSYKATFKALGEEILMDNFMQALHTLRCLTACPNKMQAVRDLIEDNPGPHLVFCEYDITGSVLAHQLETTFINGSVPVADREQIMQSMMEQNKPIVATRRAIGTGINCLAICKTVIFFEEAWTPGDRYQCLSRVQRFDKTLEEGETKEPILVFDLIVSDSIDEHIFSQQKRRGKSIKDIVSIELGL